MVLTSMLQALGLFIATNIDDAVMRFSLWATGRSRVRLRKLTAAPGL